MVFGPMTRNRFQSLSGYLFSSVFYITVLLLSLYKWRMMITSLGIHYEWGDYKLRKGLKLRGVRMLSLKYVEYLMYTSQPCHWAEPVIALQIYLIPQCSQENHSVSSPKQQQGTNQIFQLLSLALSPLNLNLLMGNNLSPGLFETA